MLCGGRGGFSLDIPSYRIPSYRTLRQVRTYFLAGRFGIASEVPTIRPEWSVDSAFEHYTPKVLRFINGERSWRATYQEEEPVTKKETDGTEGNPSAARSGPREIRRSQ